MSEKLANVAYKGAVHAVARRSDSMFELTCDAQQLARLRALGIYRFVDDPVTCLLCLAGEKEYVY